jgi:ABC-type sugar transport system substrate-binding protein
MIGQDYSAMGDYGTRTILKLINGGKVDKKIFYTPLEIVTKDNFKEILAKKKAW